MVKYQIGSVAPVAKATGGDISLYGDKWIHTFTHSGTFDTKPTWNATDVEYVVVGGGGSGGLKLYFGAGGGAGAYRTGTTPIGAHPVSTSIQIGGGGGVNHGGHPTPSPAALDGTPSYFGSPITSPGGGGGGHHSDGASRPGGSGGGGSPDTPAPMVAGGTATGDPFPGTIGSTPANGWGHNGGAGDPVSNTYWGAGGGGGAGAVGTDGTSALGGPGGVGMQLPSTFHNPMSTVGAPGPASPPFTGATTSGKYWVAGGGGGSAHSSSDPTPKSGTGGAGGGGKGGNTNNGYNAAENTGSGGGGNERNAGPQQRAGRGGSGIVMIAYPL